MNKKKIFIGLGIFWVVILGGFIGFKEFTVRSGEEVLLKTVPVDPRDLFRGDYVVLRYKISSIDLALFPDSPVFVANNTIYVEIEKGADGYGAVSNLSKEPLKGKLFIKGVVQSVYNQTIQAEYGIESYFVPAGKGLVIERWRSGGVDAKVAIDRFGNAIIKTILLDGEEVDFKNIKAVDH